MLALTLIVLEKVLLSEGVDSDAKDNSEWTALMMAVLWDHYSIAEALIAAGMSPSLPLTIVCMHISLLCVSKVKVRWSLVGLEKTQSVLI